MLRTQRLLRMLRKQWPFVLVLVLGLAALEWGLWGVQKDNIKERIDTRNALRGRRNTLEQYAREWMVRSLREGLRTRLRAMDLAELNPLEPADGLYLRVNGKQVLPRLALHEGEGAPASAYYTRLLEDAETAGDDAEWEERLSRMGAVKAALARGDRRATSAALESLLQHHAHHRLSSTRDLPGLLVVLEWLVEGRAAPEELRMLLLGSPEDLGRKWRLEGLQRLVLLRRAYLTKADFDFLRERVEALSRKAGVPVVDFATRAGELAAAPLPMPEQLTHTVLLRSGWYLEPGDKARVRGVRVDLDALLEALMRDMGERKLLLANERMVFKKEEALSPEVDLRKLVVDSSVLDEREAAVRRRFQLRTAMVVSGALVFLGLAALAFLMQYRQHRYVELTSDFVAAVSHEFRTPLAAIRLNAETLDWRLREGADAKDYPSRIIHEVDELHFLVENLLSFQSLDKGRWPLRRETVRLSELVHGLRQSLEDGAPVPVELSADVGDHTLYADAKLLRMVLGNLARNGCAYNTRSPVRLRIEALPDGRVLFSDNGVGIPRGDWERVFEDFVRLEHGPKVAGTGLGLALCRRIMELHQGSLRVAASSPEGTTFELTFPPGVTT